ncbi:DUF4158 domain-containing protein, partial [Streptomyces sp. NPDC091215]|uniref:DUF4158 domain-containing protein n=1 Tax=Streptomyces sp. NPDC091215 TaxID=3155192 RepID=UPI003444F55B
MFLDRVGPALGFAVQLTTVRFLGRFMPAPRQVPSEVADYLAEQLGIADAAVLAEYGERNGTARSRAGEIQQDGGWRDFAEVRDKLVEWLDARAWTTGEVPQSSPADDAAGQAEEDTSRPQVVKPQRPRRLGMRCSHRTVRVAGG